MGEGLFEIVESERVEFRTIVAREQRTVTGSKVKALPIIFLVLSLKVSLSDPGIKSDQLLPQIPIQVYPLFSFFGNVSSEQKYFGGSFNLSIRLAHIYNYFSFGKGLQKAQSKGLRFFGVLEELIEDTLGVGRRKEFVIELEGEFRIELDFEIGLQIIEQMAEMLRDVEGKAVFGMRRRTIIAVLQVHYDLSLKFRTQRLKFFHFLFLPSYFQRPNSSHQQPHQRSITLCPGFVLVFLHQQIIHKFFEKHELVHELSMRVVTVQNGMREKLQEARQFLIHGEPPNSQTAQELVIASGQIDFQNLPSLSLLALAPFDLQQSIQP